MIVSKNNFRDQIINYMHDSDWFAKIDLILIQPKLDIYESKMERLHSDIKLNIIKFLNLRYQFILSRLSKEFFTYITFVYQLKLKNSYKIVTFRNRTVFESLIWCLKAPALAIH